MLKKMKAGAADDAAAGAAGTSQSMRESSRQIWLAGLGAFSRAQSEGAKVFESLVKQGEALESRTKQAAFDTAAAATGAAKARAKEVQAIAGGTWDKLEQVFEDRVARALGKLGVHSQRDVERLAERVDALSAAVNELIKGSGGKPKPRAPAARPAAGAGAAAKSARGRPRGAAKAGKPGPK